MKRILGLACAVVLFAVAVAPLASAQDYTGLWMRPKLNDFTVMSEAGVRVHTEENVKHQYTRLRMVEYAGGAVTPIDLGCNDELLFDVDFSGMNMTGGAHLRNPVTENYTGPALPEGLYRLSFGGTYRHIFDKGFIAGISGRFGSASDVLFHSERELVWRTTAFGMMPIKRYLALMAWVDMDNSRMSYEFSRYPLPGAGVLFAFSEDSYVVAGFPAAQVHVEDFHGFDFDAAWRFIYSVDAKLGYRVTDKFKLWSAFEWKSDTFFRANRDDYKDRLVYMDQRVSLGATYEPNDILTLKVSAGYAFHRLFYEGYGYDDRDNTRIDLNNSVFGQAEIGVKF